MEKKRTAFKWGTAGDQHGADGGAAKSGRHPRGQQRHRLVAQPGSYTLQQNSDLAAAANWTTSGYTISTVNGTNSITILAPAGKLFFRLKQ